MRIAITMPLAEQRGGAEKILLDLLKHGNFSRVDWLVIFLEDGPMVEQVQSLGIKTQVIESGRLRELWHYTRAIIQITAVIRQAQIELLIGWMWKTHLYNAPAALLANVPTVWYQQETPSDHNKLKLLTNLLPTKGVLTITKTMQQVQAQLRPHRPTRLVYPGINLTCFDPVELPSVEEVRSKLHLASGIPIIGIVGRLQRWKGIHVLLEAMPKVLKKYSDTQCVIVGGMHDLEPDYPVYLEKQIARLALSNNVILTGLQHNIPEWMQAMDVVVHASDNEPFGIVVIEAMALGKPVVAGASGGPIEIITPEVNGLLVPFRDSAALADAILRYLNDQEFAQRIGAAAHIRAQDFSTQRYAQNFVAAIRDLVPDIA